MVANVHKFEKHSFQDPEITFQPSMDPTRRIPIWPLTNQVYQEIFGSEQGIRFLGNTTLADQTNISPSDENFQGDNPSRGLPGTVANL